MVCDCCLFNGQIKPGSFNLKTLQLRYEFSGAKRIKSNENNFTHQWGYICCKIDAFFFDDCEIGTHFDTCVSFNILIKIAIDRKQEDLILWWIGCVIETSHWIVRWEINLEIDDVPSLLNIQSNLPHLNDK